MNKYIAPFILSLWLIISCIEPYEVNNQGYRNLLVVDGLITNENKTHTVFLSRSPANSDQKAIAVTDASVSISDDLGKVTVLSEKNAGSYQTDSTSFLPEIGRIYQLHISTTDGESYLSVPCKMLPQTSITNIYYKKDKQWNLNSTEENEGLGIYLDGQGIDSLFVKWAYQEDWKFKVDLPSSYSYDSNRELDIHAPFNVQCWKKNVSNDILLYSFKDQADAEIKGKQLLFIPTMISDKLTIRYSLLVKQMTISKEEYNYWQNLKNSTEDVGDIFGRQPFSIIGNITNVTNTKEPVLGYFQVASVVSNRFYINSPVVPELNLPYYKSPFTCTLDSFFVGKNDYKSDYDIYKKEVLNGPYMLFEPIYNPFGTAIIGLILTERRCSDCTTAGSNKKPDFWED